MHPMDMNWYYDHDDIDDLKQRAVRKAPVEPFASDSRWLHLNRSLFERAINCQDYSVEFFNVKLKDNFATKVLYQNCQATSYDWSCMINDSIDAYLNCLVTVDTSGYIINRRYYIDLIVDVDKVKNSEHCLSSLLNYFN
tara:strand:- start:166 stop:582 length:417 start_codon:yes stop_codon:yes gene_type:complete